MTVWMDFNPLTFLGINCVVKLSVDAFLKFVWFWSGVGGVMVSVVMEFEGCAFEVYHDWHPVEDWHWDAEDVGDFVECSEKYGSGSYGE